MEIFLKSKFPWKLFIQSFFLFEVKEFFSRELFHRMISEKIPETHYTEKFISMGIIYKIILFEYEQFA